MYYNNGSITISESDLKEALGYSDPYNERMVIYDRETKTVPQRAL